MAETILVVDDEAQIRNTLRGVLSDEGFDVLEAEDGRARARGARAPEAAPRDRRHLDAGGRRHRAGAAHAHAGTARADHRDLGTRHHRDRGARHPRRRLRLPREAVSSSTRCCAWSAARSTSACRDAARREPIGGDDRARRTRCRRAACPQRTIGRSVVVNGQGLHSGVRTGLILQPLPPGSGIVFESIASGETVPALIDHVDSTGYATTLVRGGMVAKTVEHLMATLHAHGITNLLVKMQAEVPALDGSAAELCALLAEGGVVEQPRDRRRAGDRPPLRRRRRRSGGRRASASSPRRRLRGALHARVPAARSAGRSTSSA